MSRDKPFSDLTVVIPTLNEAKALGKAINEVLSIGVPPKDVLATDYTMPNPPLPLRGEHPSS